jgi:anti-sigma-K factor RskA
MGGAAMSADMHDDRERLRDDLAAYALGALDEPEARALERHLAECPACSERMRWLRPAVDVLPATVEQLTPPERLRESLMATVRAEAGPARAGERAGSEGAAPAGARREPAWRRLGLAGLRPAVAMTAVILLVLGIGAGYLLRGSGTEQGGSTLVKAEPANAGVKDVVSATLERQGDAAILHVRELPPIKASEVYEVWVQRAGVMEGRSIFVLRSDGTADAAVPGPLSGAQAVAVTREPRGGSKQPTNPVLLTAPL